GRRRIDLAHRVGRLLRRVDERNGDAMKVDVLELREETVAEHLRRDARTVGNEEDGAPILHGPLVGNAYIFTTCSRSVPRRQAAAAAGRNRRGFHPGRGSPFRTSPSIRRRAQVPRTPRTARSYGPAR